MPGRFSVGDGIELGPAAELEHAETNVAAAIEPTMVMMGMWMCDTNDPSGGERLTGMHIGHR